MLLFTLLYFEIVNFVSYSFYYIYKYQNFNFVFYYCIKFIKKITNEIKGFRNP